MKEVFVSEKRKEYQCGCYERRQKVVWSFYPVCETHKRLAREEWNAKPWHKKLVGYFFFGALIVLLLTGLSVLIVVIWLIVTRAHLKSFW
jgi:hypothetical protein